MSEKVKGMRRKKKKKNDNEIASWVERETGKDGRKEGNERERPEGGGRAWGEEGSSKVKKWRRKTREGHEGEES